MHCGEILDGLRAWVNGQALPPPNISNPEVDIAEFLNPGDNHIRVEASSTPFNAVKSRLDQLESVGSLIAPLYRVPSYQRFGLVDPVTTRELRKVALE